MSSAKLLTPHTKNQSPLADLVDGGSFFGNAQRMTQRQHLHSDTDLQTPGARGDGAGNSHGSRQYRTLFREMNLRQPHRIQPPAFSGLYLCKRLMKRLLFRLALAVPKFIASTLNEALAGTQRIASTGISSANFPSASSIFTWTSSCLFSSPMSFFARANRESSKLRSLAAWPPARS